jgi:hypothetical protein
LAKGGSREERLLEGVFETEGEFKEKKKKKKKIEEDVTTKYETLVATAVAEVLVRGPEYL